MEGCLEISKIADMCQKHYTRVYVHGDANILLRKSNGEGNTTKEGYIVVWIEGKKYMQHRWVWEQHNRRKLLEHETIHHINGDRTDNRIANLELWSSKQPFGQRVEDKLAWAKEIIDLYDQFYLIGETP